MCCFYFFSIINKVKITFKKLYRFILIFVNKWKIAKQQNLLLLSTSVIISSQPISSLYFPPSRRQIRKTCKYRFSLAVFSDNMSSMHSDPGAECSIGIHQFSDKFLDTTVHFQVLKMSDSFHVWCGSSPLLSNMAVAMQTKYVSRNGTWNK